MRPVANHIVDPSESSFQCPVLGDALPTPVDFWAPCCPPCGMLKPEVERFAPELAGRAHISFLNVGEHPQPAEAFRVWPIPAVLTVNGG